MEYINFNSKVIERKAKAELKKISDDFFVKVGRTNFISIEGAKLITKIRIHSSDFTNEDLKDLKYFTELKLLEIFSFNLNDLKNLPILEKLETICLRLGEIIMNIQPLENLSKLKKIDLEGIWFENLQPLSELKKLKYLNLSYCKINDLSFLENLTSITELYLNSNQIVDIAPVSNLKKLKILQLSGNQIFDLNPLKSLKCLKILHLQNNKINEVKPLGELNSLEILYLTINRIKNIESLEKCTSLKTLCIDGNQITSTEVLLRLENLTFLCTDKNEIFETLSSIFEEKKILNVMTGNFENRVEYECYSFTRQKI